MKKYEVERFSISKQMIFSENDIRSVCNTRKTNMYGNDENEHSEDDFSGYDGLAVSQAIFSADGQMQTIWSNEMNEEEINTVDDSNS